MIQRILLLNGPDDRVDAVMIRSGDRWPHRLPRKLTKQVPHAYPFWFAQGGALLKRRGYQVHYTDSIAEGMGIDGTVERFRELRPDMVVIATSTPTIHTDLLMARLAKQAVGAFTVLVDTHVTVFHRELVSEPFVDAAIRGEFEVAVPDLADALNRGTDLSRIEGVTWKRDGEVVENPDRPLIRDLDELPWPDRDLVPAEQYIVGLRTQDPCFMVMASRGCPFRCTFCLWVPVMFNNKVRFRDVGKVVDEIEDLQRRYGAREVFFHDDTVNITVRRVEEICNEILRRKLRIGWIANFRADQTTAELFRLMKRAGCTKILLGVESGSQKLLDETIDKEITLREVEDTIRWAKEAGIRVHCTYSLGAPGETRETLKETLEFIKTTDPDDIQVSLMTPIPGTPFYEKVKHQVADWHDFDGVSGRSWCDLPTAELKNAMNRIYIEHYLTPRRVLKRLSRIRNVYDVKENWRQFKAFLSRYAATGLPRPIGTPFEGGERA
jgi:anaerobic magnesium-protoporphyrin IX monomethyl ester cyclase